MGSAKAEKFTTDQNAKAKLAKALSHPGRIAILQYLTHQRTCICGDIVDELPLSQSTVSQHLKELKAVGTISGASVCYCIDPAALKRAQASFNNLFIGYEVNDK